MYNYNLESPDKAFGSTIAAKARASEYLIGLNLKKLKEYIKDDFNLTDEEYDNLIYLAAGVPIVESGFGTNIGHVRKLKEKDKYRNTVTGDFFVDVGIGIDRAKKTGGGFSAFKKGYQGGASKGFINLKNKIHPTPKKYLDLTNNDSEQLAVKAVYHLATLYDKAKLLGKVYFSPNELGVMTEFPIWDRVALMYNLGHIKTDNGIFGQSKLTKAVDKFDKLSRSYPIKLKQLVEITGFLKDGKPLTLTNNEPDLFLIPLQPLTPKIGYSSKFNIPFSSFFEEPKFVVAKTNIDVKIPYANIVPESHQRIGLNTPLVAKKDLDIFGNKIAKGLLFLVTYNGKNNYTVDVWNNEYDTPELRKLFKKDLSYGTSDSLNLLEKKLSNFKELNEVVTQQIGDMRADMYAKRIGWRKLLLKPHLKSNQDYDKNRLRQLYIPGLAWRPSHNLNGEPAIDALTNCVITECARYSNKLLLASKYPNGQKRFTDSEVGGDAWNRMTSGNNEKLLYTGFHNIPMTFGLPFTRELKTTIKQNNKLAVENFEKEFDLDQLDPNENYGVSITYYDSPNVRKAYQLRDPSNYTTNTSTHTGNVYLDPKTFDWRVVHNKGNGKVADVPMISLIGTNNKTYGITGIYLFHREPYYLAMTPQQRLLRRELEKQLYQQNIVKNTKVKKEEESGWLSSMWDRFKNTFGII